MKIIKDPILVLGKSRENNYQVWAKSQSNEDNIALLTDGSQTIGGVAEQYLKAIGENPVYSLKKPDGTSKEVVSAGIAFPNCELLKGVSKKEIEKFTQQVLKKLS